MTNALQWDGGPGHYEVYYLSATDPVSGTGLWIRYTMLAHAGEGPVQGESALWFMAMTADGTTRVGRKLSLPLGQLAAEDQPFRLTIGDAELSDRGMAGSFEDVAWELRWEPNERAYEHVHPLLRRARIAKTVLLLPHADLQVSGTVRIGDRELALDGMRGGQAHLWGSKHANRWAWMHCNDFQGLDGDGRPGDFLDAVSVFVPRFGREIGPNTPVVGRLLGEDFASTSPLVVTRNASRFGLTSWHFEARGAKRRIAVEVDAPRESLVGVTYHDPDGEIPYCYNSEVASARVFVSDRVKGAAGGWVLRDTLQSRGRAHFEYAQRTPIADVDLLVE
jgi:hypothetical protein